MLMTFPCLLGEIRSKIATALRKAFEIANEFENRNMTSPLRGLGRNLILALNRISVSISIDFF